jgi:micrococcal nuclease
MSSASCPQCGTARAGVTRRCQECGYDFWGAAANIPAPPQSDPEISFLPDADATSAQPTFWQQRSGRQKAGILGVGAFLALAVIGNFTAPPDDASGTGAGASPTGTPAATSTRRPTPSSTPTGQATPQLGSAPTGETVTGTVVDVVDGDTIKVDIGGTVYTVRYIGIDTPETVDPGSPVEWMGPEASAANGGLVAGKQVVLEKDVSETDRYDRLLRYVWLDEPDGWLLVNLELVRRGFANASSYPPDVAYQSLFRAAEREAADAGIGLWGATPVPTPSPTPLPTPAPTPVPTAQPAQCHPSYVGACLKIGAGDYDCAGGSGNGPNYVKGPIQVVGYDEFDLDRDGDGIACEG